MEGIGKLIKLNRKKANISQSELAKGICSVSYLSKTENNKIEGSAETIDLLLKRLGCNTTVEEVASKTINLSNQLHEYHYQLLDNPSHGIELEKEILSTIKKCSNSLDSSIRIFSAIVQLRLFIILESRKESNKIINELQSIYTHMNSENQIYFSLYKSQFYLNQDDLKNAEMNINECLRLLDSFKLDERLEGYLYYLKALIASYLYQPYQCLHYTEKALIIFKEEFYLSRCADCYLLMGICFKRLKELHKASYSFKKCEQLIDKDKNKKMLCKVIHNQALLLIEFNEIDEAIKLLKDCVLIKKEINDSTYYFSFLVLLKIYYRSGCIELCKEGLKEIKYNLKKIEVMVEVSILEELCDASEKKCINEKVIRLAFKKIKKDRKWKVFSEYSSWVALYFDNLKQYKKASFYYSQAFHALNNNS